ncbi:response regulator [Caulobacter sp. NIBR2454]|uniref:response regulator n=1 Tax=Caulobacter sp. NIBR2454 TaxID=3015996 RepID=UPI0022B6DF1B|nr:response regulator [Caulobacter sp. NIBR2454]
MQNAAPLILIVEDDLLVRMVAAAALEDAGYSVLEADCALEALEVLAGRSGVSVLFTDINMPGMNGLQLARVASERHPGLMVLLTSGYEQPSAEDIPPRGRFLPKPYLPEQMTAVVSALAA